MCKRRQRRASAGRPWGIMQKKIRRLLVGSILLAALPAAAAASGPGPIPTEGAPATAGASGEPLPSPLTLEEALRLFRQRGYDLLIADAAVLGARGDLVAAGQVANPNLSLSVGRVYHYDPNAAGCEGCSRYSYDAGISDSAATFDLLIGKRRLKVRVARAALEAARQSRADAERTLVSLVKQQYVQAAEAREALGFARETASATAETFRLIDLRYTAGAVSEADSARAEVAKLEAEQAVAAAEQALAAAKGLLAYYLGVRHGPVPDFDIDEGVLKYAVPPGVANRSPEEFYRLGLEHRPDLAAARAQVESTNAALALARRERIPDTTLSLLYAQTGTGQSSIQPPTATAGLSFNVPVFYRQKGEIIRAEANLRTEELARDKVEAEVVSDVRTAVTAFTAAREQVERMEGRLLERARKALDLVDLQYNNGAASLLDLLDARRTWIATNAEYRQDLTNYWTAFFQLEQAVGMELRP